MPPRTSIWIAVTRLLLGSIAPLVVLPRDLDARSFFPGRCPSALAASWSL